MELSLPASRAGTPACRAGGSWLHSQFDPSREADRFVVTALADSRPPAVVMLGPCLDYLGKSLRALLPGSTLVSVQYSPFFRGKEVFEPDYSWYPDSGTLLDSFLDSTLAEDFVSGLAVLSWPPADAAFPEEARSASIALKASLDRLASSSATVKVFGRRWISNACRNFLLAESVLVPSPSDFPVVVAAAGPSLRDSLLELAPLRGSFALVSVSSALAACRASGLEPDLVVTTDGGAWSRLHAYPLSSRRAPLAAPLTALPSACLSRGSSLLIIDQGGFAESSLLPSIGAPRDAIVRLSPHGTVSGTAIGLASRLFSGPIVAAGLDLAACGDLDHARPHGFDFVPSLGSSRLSTEEGRRWSRVLESAPDRLESRPWRRSRSLAAYASGLDASLRHLRGRLFRLNPSPVYLESFEDLDSGGARMVLDAGRAPRSHASPPALTTIDSPLPSRAAREASLDRSLAGWDSLVAKASSGLARGLPVDDERVAELLRSLDIADYAAARRALVTGGDPRPAAADLAARSRDFLDGLRRRLLA